MTTTKGPPMRLAAVISIAAACALGACQDRDAEKATPPVSPGTEPNAPAGQIPPPQPAPEGGDVMGAEPTPGTGAPLPSTPPTLPEDKTAPPPVESPPQ